MSSDQWLLCSAPNPGGPRVIRLRPVMTVGGSGLRSGGFEKLHVDEPDSADQPRLTTFETCPTHRARLAPLSTSPEAVQLAVSFLEREFCQREAASRDFPPQVTPSVIQSAIRRYERRMVCFLRGFHALR
ncbi:hypothetical protein V8E54_005356 [Elaphomyces granulatus]